MDDYYAGVAGVRRLIKELDHVLQHMVDSVEPTESMECAIAMRLKSGERIELNKTYRHTEREVRSPAAAQ